MDRYSRIVSDIVDHLRTVSELVVDDAQRKVVAVVSSRYEEQRNLDYWDEKQEN